MLTRHDPQPTTRRLLWFCLAVLGASAACRTSEAPAEPLHLNDIQVLGSHNSYKQAIDPSLFGLFVARSPDQARALEYHHASLTEQLDLGLRLLELDIFHDPEGGRYARPRGLQEVALAGLRPGPAFDPEGLMQAPGFKVLHVQDIDFRSNCLTLRRCLEEIDVWSKAHPAHVPIVITMNTKDATIDRAGYVAPLPFNGDALDALDREILSVLPRQRLITPQDVRGDAVTLIDAVLADGWPTLDEARGRLLFVLDQQGEKLERYVAGHPSLAGRILFVNAPPDRDEAAFLILNDPIDDGARIRQLVIQGYLVRTRADANTREARTGETERREAAFSSGAQFVSTDYYWPNPDFGTGYEVAMPGRVVVRCNPVRQPPDCSVSETATQ